MALHDKLDRIHVGHLEGILRDQAQRVEDLTQIVRTTLTSRCQVDAALKSCAAVYGNPRPMCQADRMR